MLQRARRLHHQAIFTQNCFQYETKQTVIWIQSEISGIVSRFRITHPGFSTWNRLLAQGTVDGGWKISSLFGGSNFTKACGAGSKVAVSASRRIVTEEWGGSRWRGYRSMQLSITFKLSHITHSSLYFVSIALQIQLSSSPLPSNIGFSHRGAIRYEPLAYVPCFIHRTS